MWGRGGVLTGVQTLDDGRRVHQVPPAQHAHQVSVEARQLEPRRAVHPATMSR